MSADSMVTAADTVKREEVLPEGLGTPHPLWGRVGSFYPECFTCHVPAV